MLSYTELSILVSEELFQFQDDHVDYYNENDLDKTIEYFEHDFFDTIEYNFFDNYIPFMLKNQAKKGSNYDENYIYKDIFFDDHKEKNIINAIDYELYKRDFAKERRLYQHDRALWRGVLLQAFVDLKCENTNKREYILRKNDAIKWFSIDNISFHIVCDYADYDPEFVLKKAYELYSDTK